MAKQRRRRRTKREMIADKAAEEKAAQKKVTRTSKSDNIAEAVQDIVKGYQEGSTRPSLEETIKKKYKITNLQSVFNAAEDYIIDSVFKDNISFYAEHISELEYLYNMSIGRGIPNPNDVKKFEVNYTEALKIRKEIEEARLTVIQLIQFR